MKILKLLGVFVGLFAFLFGTTSCKKDETECCTLTYAGQTEKVCEDDEDLKEELKDYDMTWADYKAFVGLAGGSCD